MEVKFLKRFVSVSVDGHGRVMQCGVFCVVNEPTVTIQVLMDIF